MEQLKSIVRAVAIAACLIVLGIIGAAVAAFWYVLVFGVIGFGTIALIASSLREQRRINKQRQQG